MPCESSSQISNSTNGIEPPRGFISVKQSKDGILKQVVPEYEKLHKKYELLWDIKDNEGYLQLCAIMQKFVDQSISTNTHYDPSQFEGSRVPMKLFLMDLLKAYKYGIKTLYYHTTRDGSGDELVKGSLKEQRIGNWLDFANKHPTGALFCFRGGLRSKIAQEWIYEQSGISFPRIKGGYKAIRSFLIDEMSRIINEKKLLVLGGQTGCGKTLLLNELDNSIDLEGFANHRGSAFGNDVTPQPRQIDFENQLTVELIKKEIYNVFLIEDEGNNIGMIHMPDAIKIKARQSDIIILNASLEERLSISLKSYVIDIKQKFIALHGDFGFELYSNYWLNSLSKIQKSQR